MATDETIAETVVTTIVTGNRPPKGATPWPTF